MTRKDHFAEADSDQWPGYFSKAEEHRATAAKASEDGNYDSAAVLIVQAGINYADAVTIFVLGRKSTSDSHGSVLKLLEDRFTDAKDREAIRHLGRVLSEKGRVEYTGQRTREREWKGLARHLDRFRAWIVTKLPPARSAT